MIRFTKTVGYHFAFDIWSEKMRHHAVLSILVSLISINSISRAAVTDFPELNSSHPTYGQLYSDVNVGVATIPESTWSVANETFNAVYAYLHPQSPHRYNTAYLDRLKLLLGFRFDEYTDGSGLGDMSGCFQACYAYMLLKHHRPSDLTASEMTDWEGAMIAFAQHQLSSQPQLYNDYIIANQWINGDIRMAMAVYFTGVATSNATYQSKGANAINLHLTQCISGDGGIHKSGYQNSAPGYRNWDVNWMIWWWVITGAPEAKAMLDKTIHWVPLSVEPSGFAMQSTANAVKHMYNKWFGQQNALALAYLYGDRYNYYIGQVVENEFSNEASILMAALYQGPLTPLVPPTDFILHDRAVMGPRVRTPDWACIATARDPQTAAPEHADQGFEGRQCGKNTFVGAAALGAWANDTSLKAALDGVAVEFKNKQGTTTDWARSNYDGGMYRFLAQDEKTSTITRETFGTLSTSYRLSERTTGGSTPSWGSGTDWLGEQVWLLTKDRLVGLVQIHNDEADTVYGLDTRVVLVGGRYPILGQYHDVVEVAPDDFEFGELKVRVPQTTFSGPRSVQRTTVYGSNSSDNYTALLRLHDAADSNNDTPISYPAGTRRWALIECVHEDGDYASAVKNVKQENYSVAVLQVEESDRRFRIIQNLTNSTRTYTGNMGAVTGGTATLHKSWINTVDVITPAPGAQVAISIELPPYAHAIVVSSGNTTDHNGNTQYYEDLFPDGDSTIAWGQEIDLPKNSSIGIELDGFVSMESPIFGVDSQPSHGTLAGVPPILSYTPPPEYTGEDSFLFSVRNSKGESSQAEIKFNVGDESVTGNWYPAGKDVDRTFSNMTDSGFTLLFHDQSDDRNDVAALNDFNTPITLDPVHQTTMSMKFSITNLTTTNGAANLLRIGFRNDESGDANDATLHYIFGYGAPGNHHDVRFAGNSNTAHFFSGGTSQDQGSLPGANALSTGNASEIELKLNYLENNGDGTHDYRAIILWDGHEHSSSTITRNTDTWDSAYIQANNGTFQVAGDGFTISDTVISTPMPTYFDLSYRNWQQHYGLLDSGIEQDSDSDGVNDVIEFALGTKPDDPSSHRAQFLQMDPGGQMMTYWWPRRKYYEALGVSYQIEVSDDLIHWSPLVMDGQIIPDTDDLEWVSYEMAPQEREFFRIKVEVVK
ncbi:MAG: Ig-like domain-containing protein [Verrucomicrobiota bacterium]